MSKLGRSILYASSWIEWLRKILWKTPFASEFIGSQMTLVLRLVCFCYLDCLCLPYHHGIFRRTVFGTRVTSMLISEWWHRLPFWVNLIAYWGLVCVCIRTSFIIHHCWICQLVMFRFWDLNFATHCSDLVYITDSRARWYVHSATPARYGWLQF